MQSNLGLLSSLFVWSASKSQCPARPHVNKSPHHLAEQQMIARPYPSTQTSLYRSPLHSNYPRLLLRPTPNCNERQMAQRGYGDICRSSDVHTIDPLCGPLDVTAERAQLLCAPYTHADQPRGGGWNTEFYRRDNSEQMIDFSACYANFPKTFVNPVTSPHSALISRPTVQT